MQSNKIYTICMIRKDSKGTQHKRVMGFSFYKNQAIEWIKNNDCDIHEEYYTYAVIEEFAPGVYYLASYQLWFEWIEGKYQEIDKPDDFTCICNFAMG